MTRYLLVMILILSACTTTYTLVEPGRIAVTDVYTVQPAIEWSRVQASKDHVWTVDGVTLQVLFFSRGIREGESIFKGSGTQPGAVFRAGMTETEIAELIVDELSRAGNKDVVITSLRPQNFGSSRGFALDIDYLKGEGLESRAFVSGAVVDSSLYVIMYFAPRQYYFDRHLPEVKAIVESIELRGAPRAPPAGAPPADEWQPYAFSPGRPIKGL